MQVIEKLFSVQLRSGPTKFGDHMTLEILNPDGSLLDAVRVDSGPDGPAIGDEARLVQMGAELLGEVLDEWFTASKEERA